MKRKLLSLLLLVVVGGASEAWAQINLLAEEGVTVTGKSGTETIEITKNIDQSISYSCSNEVSIELNFNTPVKIDASKAYVVLEASDAYTSTRKLRNITLDGTIYDQGGNANCSSKEIDGHQVLIMSPLGRNGSIFTAYVNAGDNTMDLTKVGFNLKPASGTDFTIYRIGFYNIAEIESLYGNPTLRFYNAQTSNLRLEFGGNANQIIVNNNNITMTQAESVVFLKSLGNLPSTFTVVNLRGLTLSDIDTAKPFNKDLMSNLSNVSRVLISTTAYKYYPTANRNIYVLGNRYYDYRDSENPSTTNSNQKQDGTNGRYFSYTRNFVEGYSTCILPFTLDISNVNDNLSFYTFTSQAGGNVVFSKVEGTFIECNTPFIVKAAETGLYLLTNVTTDNHWNEGKSSGSYQGYKYYETSTSNNVSFVGSFMEEAPMGSGNAYEGYTCYGITTDGAQFAKMADDTKTTYYRAFLCDKRASGARALNLSFDDGNGTTAIVSPEAVNGLMQSDYFDLQGRRVSNPTKGLYIVNGKKMFIK